MSNYIVMQGHTYEEEKELGIIWSPQRDRGGKVPHSWQRMKEVKQGDKVFHYVKGNIVAVSNVIEDCRVASKPDTMQNHSKWNNEGYLINLRYHELRLPLNIRENFQRIQPLLPVKYSPFQKDGNGNQGYLYPCNEELAIKILELISEGNIEHIDETNLSFEDENNQKEDYDSLMPILFETEYQSKVKARRGQQKFREGLLELWDNECALCGINLPTLLRASHSKPWKDSTNEERLDPYNGVLLCCNHDVLYDKGFITFDAKGFLHISSKIFNEDHLKYGLVEGDKIQIKPNNKTYFKWHMKNVFVDR